MKKVLVVTALVGVFAVSGTTQVAEAHVVVNTTVSAASASAGVVGIVRL
jgi:hypothetical protein